jgi:hypothetical protein
MTNDKEYQREYNRQYYLRNKEKIKAQTKAYKENNSEYCSEYSKQYRLDNLDKLQAYGKEYARVNSEKAVKRAVQWQKDNPAKVRLRGAKRRAAKLEATPSWLSGPQLAHIERTYKLASIIQEETGMKYHVDHIVPLQGSNVCGLHVPWNLQVIPASVNASKSNKFKG